MTEEQWLDPACSSVVAVFDGRAAEAPGADRSLIVMVNSSEHRVLGRIPPDAWPGRWERVLDTAEQGARAPPPLPRRVTRSGWSRPR